MGFYEDRLLPRIVDKALGRPEIDEIRARVCAGLGGEVLEVGFGSGRNVRHYPAAVTRVRAVDPATAGRKLAAPRIERGGVPVEFVGLVRVAGCAFVAGSCVDPWDPAMSARASDQRTDIGRPART